MKEDVAFSKLEGIAPHLDPGSLGRMQHSIINWHYQGPPPNLTWGVPNLTRPATTAQFERRAAIPASNPTRPGANLARPLATLH